MANEGISSMQFDDDGNDDDAPIVRRQVTDYEPASSIDEEAPVSATKSNAVDDLFGSDDEDDGEEEIIQDSAAEEIGERQIYRAVRNLLVADSINWTVNSWAARVGEVLNVNFSERRDLKDILKNIVLEQSEAIKKAAEQSNELFGGSDDDDDDRSSDDDGIPLQRGRSLDFLHDEEEPNASQLQDADRDTPVVKQKTTSNLLLPEVNRFLDGAHLVYMKPPQQLKIQAKPFIPSTYSAEEEYKEFVSQEDAAPGMSQHRFFEENSILRWSIKLGPDGKPIIGSDGKEVRVSNAFFVKYKNGLQRLVIGKTEFDVQFHPISNRFIYTLVKSEDAIPPVADLMNEAPLQQPPKSGVVESLECVGRIGAKAVLQRIYRGGEEDGMQMVASKGKKVLRISAREDPEKQKEAKIQREDILLRKNEKRRRAEPSSYRYGSRSSAMSTSYLENEDGVLYDDTDISAIKKTGKGKGKFDSKRSSGGKYDDEDDDDDDEVDGKDDDKAESDRMDDEDFDDEDTAGPPTSRRRESRALAEDDEYDVETEQNVQSTKRARQSVLNDSDEDS